MIALPGASASPPAQAPAPAAAPAKRGRPSDYTRAVADAILQRLAEGQTLRSICAGEDMPAASTVRLWVIDDRDGFAERSARAFAIGWESLFDECLDIADDSRNDFIEELRESGVLIKFDSEAVQRSKLRIDTRMRMLGKWAPKRFGEKIELGGSVELTLAQRLKQLDAERVPEHAQMPPGVDL